MKLVAELAELQVKHEREISAYHRIQAHALLSGEQVTLLAKTKGLEAAVSQLVKAAAHLLIAADKLETETKE